MQEEKIGGINAFWLKIIAITGMVLQHTALAMPGTFPLGVEIVMQMAGGFTFPILAFLLVEGFRHTSNVGKYMGRLAIFGGISIIPHLLVLGTGLNVMFTLLLGLFLLYLRREIKNRFLFWVIAIFLSLVGALFDWGFVGPISIVLYDMIKSEKVRRIVVPIFFAVGGIIYGMVIMTVLAPFIDFDAIADMQTIAGAFFPLGVLLTIPIMLSYKGERGRRAKWFFYLFYPTHFIVIAAISIALGRNAFINAILGAL